LKELRNIRLIEINKIRKGNPGPCPASTVRGWRSQILYLLKNLSKLNISLSSKINPSLNSNFRDQPLIERVAKGVKNNLKVYQSQYSSQGGIDTLETINKQIDSPIYKEEGRSLVKNYNMNIRKFLYKYNLMNHVQNSQSILYNFIKLKRRINTLDSFDYTGSLLRPNISILLKYFFKQIGPALITKPIFIFNHDKIIIQLGYYIKKFSKYRIRNMRELKITRLFKLLAMHRLRISNRFSKLNKSLNNKIQDVRKFNNKERRLILSVFRSITNRDILSIFRVLPNSLELKKKILYFIRKELKQGKKTG